MSERLHYRIAVVTVYGIDWFDLKCEVNDEVQDNERVVAVQYETVPMDAATGVKRTAILTLESSHA